jgi:hypothetical protein
MQRPLTSARSDSDALRDDVRTYAALRELLIYRAEEWVQPASWRVWRRIDGDRSYRR